MIAFRMPSLGADMEAGTLVEWFKQPGETLHKGDIIALVETQKGAIEIEVFHEGTVAEHVIQPGQKVPVGTVIANILESGEQAGQPSPLPAPAEARPAEAEAKPAPSAEAPAIQVLRPAEMPLAAPGPVAPAISRPKVTPVARRRAMELGLELAGIAPGKDGVIGLAEIAAAKPEAGEEKEAVPKRAGLDLGEMRKAIAAAMSRSHRDIPHYWVSHAIDVTALMHWLQEENARRPVEQRLLYVAPLIKAIAVALRDVPELNGRYENDAFAPSKAIHVGFATSLRGGGLVAPAIRDVDGRTLGDLMAALADLVPRARAGRLRSSEMTDATVTVSNLGEGSAESVLPLIYPPQVAIIGCGAVLPRPWAVGDTVAIRQVMNVTVGGDHRVSHGRHAGQFLVRLAALLSVPEAL